MQCYLLIQSPITIIFISLNKEHRVYNVLNAGY
jgi:hypothetical protein